MNLMVECACGWVTRGEENQVIEAMQVHTRLIHGREITREEVLAEAEKRRRVQYWRSEHQGGRRMP